MSLNIGSEANREQALKTLFHFMQFENQYPRFLEVTALRIVNEEIIDPIQKRMAAAGYSEKIINSTSVQDVRIGSDGIMEFDIISDYESETGFDVSKAREEGTDGIFLRPVFKLALSWIERGIRAFSFGHWRPGIDGTNIIHDTVKEKADIAQAKLDQETDEMLTKILKS